MNAQTILRLNKIQNELPQVLNNINEQYGLPEGSGYFSVVFNTDDNLWKDILDHCKYQQHEQTKQVRNKKTNKILSPNKRGRVALRKDSDNKYRQFRAVPYK